MLTYSYRYNRIIKWFKEHPINKFQKDTELHHIIPKSCGGLDIEENLILLPTRWHYIVHCWLPMVYLEAGMKKEYNSMLFAWNRMQNYRKDFRSSLGSIKEDSLLYQRLRNEYSILLSNTMPQKTTGVKNSQFGKHWWKDPNDKTKSLSIKEGDPIPEGWIRGKWQIISNEGLENIRCGCKKHLGGFMITNGEINRWLNKEDKIPDGFWKGMRIKNKSYIKEEFREKKKLSEEELHQIRSEATKISNETRRKILFKKNYPLIKEQYEYWLNHSWKDFIKKYNYKYTQVNFNNQCKKYLGKEWHPKKNFSLAKCK